MSLNSGSPDWQRKLYLPETLPSGGMADVTELAPFVNFGPTTAFVLDALSVTWSIFNGAPSVVPGYVSIVSNRSGLPVFRANQSIEGDGYAFLTWPGGLSVPAFAGGGLQLLISVAVGPAGMHQHASACIAGQHAA